MKPLNPVKYYRENKKKAMLVIVILFLTVLAISAINSIIRSAADSAETTTVQYLKTASVVFLPPDNADTLKKIENFDSVDKDKLLKINGYEQTYYYSIAANTEAVILFSQNSLSELVQRFGLTVKSGRLPDSDKYEIAMHEVLLKNRGLKVGDEFGSDVNENEWIEGRYKIVGSLTGNTVISVGTKNHNVEMAKTFEDEWFGQLLIFPSSKGIEAMNADIEALTRKEVNGMITYNTRRIQLDGEIAGFQNVLNIIMVIMVIALGVSLGAVIMIAYNDRKGEFGILSAIGYSKREIRNFVCKEIGILALVASVVGYALSLALLSLLDIAIFSSKGSPLTVFTPMGLVFAALVPVMVFIFAAVPVILRLRKTDLVLVIEGR